MDDVLLANWLFRLSHGQFFPWPNAEVQALHEESFAPPQSLRLGTIWRKPLPHQKFSPLTRFLVRMTTTLSKRYVMGIEGQLDQLGAERDPTIFVANHNQRYEALMLPSLLFYLRDGKPVHFMADWNFALIPMVGLLYRHGQTILITRKKAKPKFLNVFKPLYRHKKPAFDRALERLRAGGAVGIFPEGTVNRDPLKLMRGLPGAARLALESGARVIPLGIRFPEHEGDGPIPDGAKMTVDVGYPIFPPAIKPSSGPLPEEIEAFHVRIMMALAEESGKAWHPSANKRRKYVV